jgi:hypothetical protein
MLTSASDAFPELSLTEPLSRYENSPVVFGGADRNIPEHE